MIHLSYRGRFEGLCSSIFRKCVEPIEDLVHKAHLDVDDILHVSAYYSGNDIETKQVEKMLYK